MESGRNIPLPIAPLLNRKIRVKLVSGTAEVKTRTQILNQISARTLPGLGHTQLQRLGKQFVRIPNTLQQPQKLKVHINGCLTVLKAWGLAL